MTNREDIADAGSHAAWTRYWASGATRSCGSDQQGSYGGALQAYWNKQFAGIGPTHQVLDVAAGSGALLRLYVDAHHDAMPTWHAIDLADVKPAWVQQLPAQVRQNISFQGAVDAAALPFADDSFDWVVSNYGIEYADRSRTLGELLRVLRPGGRAVLLMHHAQGRPVQMGRDELAHIAWLLQSGGLLDSAVAILTPLSKAHLPAERQRLASDKAALQLRDDFNAHQRALAQRVATADCPDILVETRTVIADCIAALPSRGLQVATQQLRAWTALLQDQAERLTALQHAAMDDVQLRGWLAPSAPRCSASVTTVIESGHLMGWAVELDPDTARSGP